MGTELLFGIALFLPLAGGVLSLILGRELWVHTATQALFAVGGVVGLGGVISFFSEPVTFSTALLLPGVLGGAFSVTLLSSFFLALLYLGVVLTSLYSVWYLPHYRERYSLPWLNAASAVFIVAMEACALSTTVFGFLLFWEVMSIAVYFLVVADRSQASLQAGFLYFVMTHLGFASLLAGFLTLSGGDPFLNFSEVAVHAATLSPLSLGAAFVLLFIGFGSKAGLVPFHRWLPAAHPAAPSGSSALLSGVMLKIAVFGFVQALFLFPVFPLWYGLVVFGFGLLSAFFGAMYAAVESDLKRLLAWSSIENLGLIFSGLGALGVMLALPSGAVPEQVIFGLLFFVTVHTLSHSVFKTGLFMVAGAVTLATHTRDMDEMGGLARSYPWLSVCFLILSLSAVALPPFVTFYGEWAYLQSLALSLTLVPLPFAVGVAFAISVLALIAGLALFAFSKAFSAVFLGRGRNAPSERVSMQYLVAPIAISAALTFALGFVVRPLGAFLRSLSIHPFESGVLTLGGGAFIDPVSVFLLLAIVGVGAFLVWQFLGSGRTRVTDTWDCGQELTPRMEYTATGFAAPIRFFFRGLVITRKRLIAHQVSPDNQWIQHHTLEWDVTSFWARWLYMPIGDGLFFLAHRIKLIQNGNIQFYLLLVFVALIATIISAL